MVEIDGMSRSERIAGVNVLVIATNTQRLLLVSLSLWPALSTHVM